jgi:hypothetical protein
MAQQQFLSVLDQISAELEKEGAVGYRVTPQQDQISFGFPEATMKPMSQQLQEAIRTDNSPYKEFKPHDNDKQFVDKNKQLQLPASSTIQQAAYWPSKEYLVVSFKSGHTYDYSNVPLLVMLQWEQAKSAGSFFYYNIRMSFKYRKVG